MLDFQRFRPAAPTLLSVLAILTCMFWVADLLLQSPVKKWSPNRTLLQDTLKKSEAAWEANVPVGLIVGTSSSIDGFTIATLEDLTELRWMNLAVLGGSLDRLALSLEPFFRSELRPEVIVLGLHPVSVQPQVKDNPLNQLQDLFRTYLEKLAMRVQSSYWRAERIENPFLDQAQHSGPPRPRSIEVQVESMRIGRTFEPESYNSSSREAQILRGLLQELALKTDNLILVLMPEHSELRQFLPQNAEANLEQIIEGYPTFDLRDLLEDENFVDLLHINESGRAALTPKLAELLNSTVSKSSPRNEKTTE